MFQGLSPFNLENLVLLDWQHSKTSDDLGVKISRFLGHLFAIVGAGGDLVNAGRVENEQEGSVFFLDLVIAEIWLSEVLDIFQVINLLWVNLHDLAQKKFV